MTSVGVAVVQAGSVLFDAAATHRELVPTAAERHLWGQGDGPTMPGDVHPVQGEDPQTVLIDGAPRSSPRWARRTG